MGLVRVQELDGRSAACRRAQDLSEKETRAPKSRKIPLPAPYQVPVRRSFPRVLDLKTEKEALCMHTPR